MTEDKIKKASVAYQDKLLDTGKYIVMSISDHFEAGVEWVQ